MGEPELVALVGLAAICMQVTSRCFVTPLKHDTHGAHDRAELCNGHSNGYSKPCDEEAGNHQFDLMDMEMGDDNLFPIKEKEDGLGLEGWYRDSTAKTQSVSTPEGIEELEAGESFSSCAEDMG